MTAALDLAAGQPCVAIAFRIPDQLGVDVVKINRVVAVLVC
jgi:hypothetical protein